MSRTQTASEQIIEEVTTWPGVEAAPGSRGELSLKVGRREIGHLHGDHAAHFGFPRKVWERLLQEGRVVRHPIARDGWAARRIDGAEDVREVIELLRMNYDRAVARGAAPGRELSGLHATPPEPLRFAPALDIRAFLLERERGNLLVYNVPGLRAKVAALDGARGISRWYLNHRHEAMVADQSTGAPLFVHEDESEAVADRLEVAGTFTGPNSLVDADFEAIPTPGHTPGATAYLWRAAAHTYLFTGDTIYLDDGEWVAAVLASSDRTRYLESLELIRGLEFDVLVPWAATRGQPYYALTDEIDARRRIDAILARVRRGESR